MRVVVAGASVAGVAAAHALRDEGFDGEIVMIGDERHPPYDRPPLSKQLLAGTITPDEIGLPAAPRLAECGVEHRRGRAVEALDLSAREVVLAGGEPLRFDGLIAATGSRARRLAIGPPPAGVHVLRTLDDAVAVREALLAADDLVVIGAGFIGIEVASSARLLERRVTVLEAAPLPMTRVVGEEIAGWFVDLAAEHGVEVRCGVSVTGFEQQDGHVTGVRLAGGEVVPAGVVVVGVGAVPNDEWLRTSGLAVADGLVCDAALRAGPGIYAAGDVARWQHPLFGSIRVEHWSTAGQHARTAAANLVAELAGDGAELRVAGEVPYFWSDQFGHRIQMAGWSAAHDAVRVSREGDRRVAQFGRGGRLVAALTFDWPAELARQRKAIAAQTAWDQTG